MPEGDTIHRAARTLQKAIGGREVKRFETVVPTLARVDDESPIRGRSVETVTAVGKHLLIAFSGGLVLRSHLRMNGSWHIYRPGETWMRPRVDMRVVIATDEWIAVGFNLPVVEFLDERSLARSADLRSLGPDLVAADFDAGEARRRIRLHPRREIADVLLNQHALSGIGNIYKSEVLFIRGVSPFSRVAELGDEQLDALISTASKLLKHNVESTEAARETRRGLRRSERFWVYGRRGEPCRRCGSVIEMRKQGPDARVTFWCPKCQPQSGDGD